MSIELDEMGPIDYLVVEFPGGRTNGEGLPLLAGLVDRGIIRILDLRFFKKLVDGSVADIEVKGRDGDGMNFLEMFDGATSGLLSEEDVRAAAEAIEPGSMGGLLVYENRWAAPLATSLRRGGAQLVAGGRIPVQALLAALEIAETAAT